jgi:two-component system nitrogen regulation sensor histidine kinase NtrY
MAVEAATESGQVELRVGEGRRWLRIFGLIVVLSAVVSSVASFLILTGQTRIEPTPLVVRTAEIVNGALVLLLVGIVAYEAAGVWIARQRGRAAARLHVRIVLLFSVIAALPAILMMIIALMTLSTGLDRWFAGRTQQIIETSHAVAQAYVEEHSRMLGLDLLAIAGEFNRVNPDINANLTAISGFLTNQGHLRGLSTVQLIHQDGSVIAEGDTDSDVKAPPAPKEIFKGLDSGEPALIAPGTTSLVGGIIKLTSFNDVYLYMARPIDPRVTRNLRLTDENAAEYEQLRANRFGVQVAFAIVFAGVALVVLLSAIWIGIGFAGSLVSPIRRLIGAAEEISAGNLDVRVPARSSMGDISLLATTFNTMAGQVKSQRDELISANEKSEHRRRFTEAVLSGVSAGVIGLDGEGRVTLVNRSALQALGVAESDLVGRPLGIAIPALATVVGEARQRFRGPSHAQIQIAHGNDQRTLNVQVTQERSNGRIEGLVVTLDDITDLVTAQRTSAWADIARRIAHEIKNPLTPIQLSAERLKRKYGKIITEDKAVFDQCTDTIVRQVDDIKRMVDEFSRFARMPKPVMTSEDVADTVRQAVFLQRVGNPDIDIDFDPEQEKMPAKFDRRLISQALTNIIKNATEAIAAVPPAELGRGRIYVSVKRDGHDIVIDVIDNGTGLPKENRNRLLEPYVTTREKGTGLGLAIVGRILEEHGGKMNLFDAPDVASGGRGAWMQLRFAAETVGTADAAEKAQVLEPASER